jgi:hypothetical protein
VTRAFMMELESDGTANWIKAYGDAATASLGRGIDRRGGDYVMVYNQFDDLVAASSGRRMRRPRGSR